MKAITSDKKKEIKSESNKSTRNARSESIFELAALGLLTAISFIMAFTPLGFIPIGLLTVTFMTIPVIVSATVLKPRDSAIIGGIFGLTSFIKTVTGTGGAMMAAFFQINPLFTCILCIVPRILEGLLGGLIFQAVSKKDKTKFVSYIVASLSVPILNTILFMSTLFLFFYSSEYIQTVAAAKGADNVLTLFVAMVGVQAVVEALVCAVLGTAVSKALAVALKKIRK